MSDERMYSPAALATKVGLSRAVIYQLISRGELAVIRRGSGSKAHKWIEWSAWESYKASHRQPARGGDAASTPRPRADISDLPGHDRYAH